MKTQRFIAVLGLLLLIHISVFSQSDIPTIEPTASIINKDGEEVDSTSFSGDAPFEVHFRTNPQNQGAYNAHYEWRFTKEGATEPYLIRYEEDTDYTFTEAGTHSIVCYAVFTNGSDRHEYTEEYWKEEKTPIKVIVSESMLEMPNAFSPNGDGDNEIYKAKKFKSLVEFHAIIFNRWGQKLYEWNDPEGGWDGTFNGKPVKDGVYYVSVRAKGSDGRKYSIRRDVNLLRGYYTNGGSNTTEN